MRSRRIWIAVLLVAAVAYGSWHALTSRTGEQKVAFRPARQECGVGGNGLWSYCISTALQGTNGALAYHFHGRDQDARKWNDDSFYTALIQQSWESAGSKPPTVVSISFGALWLLSPKTKGDRSGLLETFLNEVVPEIEAKTGKPGHRVVFGESMGGLNTLLVALKTSGLFRKAISLCPPVYLDSPFVPLPKFREFLQRTGADPRILWGLRTLAPQFIGDEQDWREISPNVLIEQVEPKGAPEIYLSVGLYDRYGNFEGAEHFARRAAERGLKVTWRPLYGGHCAIDIPSVARAIVEP